MARQRIDVIDSHTAGEPTRVVLAGGPQLGDGPLSQRRDRFAREYDALRSAIVNEPRGSDVLVGALLCEPHDPTCDAGVIFFNNVGLLGMCGHGTIGLVATLAELGRIGEGPLRIETPVGVVIAEHLGDGRVAVRNVPSRRIAEQIAVETEAVGTVRGEIAWGGNWFFLCQDHGERIAAEHTARLTEVAWSIRHALNQAGIHGDDGGEIDHIELLGPPSSSAFDSRNFVLCPGGAYDRSPCGTGLSAKLACLAASGRLKPGETWRQESVIGTSFEGSYEMIDGQVLPTIRGAAYITGEATLILDDRDPLRDGIRR